MYTHIYIYTHTHIYIYIYIYTHTHTYIYIHIHTHIHIHIYIYIIYLAAAGSSWLRVRGLDWRFSQQGFDPSNVKLICLATLMSSDRKKQICLWMTIYIYIYIYIYMYRAGKRCTKGIMNIS